MEERVGLFACECGPNIKNLIDLNRLCQHVSQSESLAMVEVLPFCCSPEGQTFITEGIAAHHLDRVVIAACSPLEHEHTFHAVMARAGLNPFLLQMANIREQCAWVTRNVGEATAKAIELVQAALARVKLHHPLVAGEIECQSDILVVGAGIAGISAALALTQKERKVYLVERSPWIGGKTSEIQHMFPNLECVSCAFATQFDKVLHSEQIRLFTMTEVQSLAGYIGNFLVELRQGYRGVDPDICVGCGLCQEACPVETLDESRGEPGHQSAIFIPFPGALPHVAVIDRNRCLRTQGHVCDACQTACPYGAVRYDDADLVHQVKVGAVVVATGCELFDPSRAPQYGYGTTPNVITSMELERLLNTGGPTGGRILRADGQPPNSVALVHCVGSRSEVFNAYCSGICCRLSLKYSAQLLQHMPESRVTLLHSDWCMPGGDSQRTLTALRRNDRIRFVRLSAPDALEVVAQGESTSIRYRDEYGHTQSLTADLVVLLTAMEGARDAVELADLLHIGRNEDGFFAAAHPQTDPLTSIREGILLAGCALAPGDIPTAVAQGQAAAGKILARLVPGETLPLSAVTAEVVPELCSRCGLCQASCPSSAIDFPMADSPPTINAVLCEGCGVCTATCPSGAIDLHHYTDKQLSAEWSRLVGESPDRGSHDAPPD